MSGLHAESAVPEPNGSDLERLRAVNAQLVQRAQQLETALHSRIVIEQAKGILSARHGLSIDDAFELLRQAARSRRTPLHELADRVVHEPATPAAIRMYLPTDDLPPVA